MLVLQANRIFFKHIFLLGSGKRLSIDQYVKTGLFLSIELFLVIPAMVYFVQNIRNIRSATESMYGIASFRQVEKM